MFRDHVTWSVAVLTVGVLSVSALGQPEYADTPAFITVVAGGGAERISGDKTAPIKPAAFSLEQNGLAPGEGIRTARDGAATIVLAGVSAVAYLEGATELRVLEKPGADSGAGVSLIVIGGRVSVVQKPDSDQWIHVATGPTGGRVVAYTLSKGCSLFIEAGATGASFASRLGDAWYFPGPAPDGRVIDAATGKPVTPARVALPRGQRISIQMPDKPLPDKDANIVVPVRLASDTYAFGLVHSDQWLQSAEQGDFTPVRTAARGAPEMLTVEVEPTLAFDQPMPVSATPAPRPVSSAVRTTVNPGQSLIQSGIPGSVVAGERYLRSRVVGNPGATGTGALAVNRSARLPIRLGD